MASHSASDQLSSNMMKQKCSGTVKIKRVNGRFNPYDLSNPKGRSGHCMCADESNIYMFGGYSPADPRNGVESAQVLPELWKFNFASQKWILVETTGVPHTCASTCISVHNKKVYVFGGTGFPFGQIMSNTIKTMNVDTSRKTERTQPSLQAAGEENVQKKNSRKPKANNWCLLETGAMSFSGGGEVEDVVPLPAYGRCMIFHKDGIYVFGGAIGYYSEAVADLHRLNIGTMEWEKLTPSGKAPTGRYKFEWATDSERIYIFGGGRLSKAENLEDIYVYHIGRNHWTREKAKPDPEHGIPQPRCSFGCVQDGDNVYVSGGRYYSSSISHKPLSDIWHLQLNTLQWHKLSVKLPHPLYFHTAAVSPSGSMYIFGGVHKDNFRSPDLLKLRLPYSVPKLSELSWNRVCKMARSRKCMDKTSLASLGVPWTFLDRVEVPSDLNQ